MNDLEMFIEPIIINLTSGQVEKLMPIWKEVKKKSNEYKKAGCSASIDCRAAVMAQLHYDFKNVNRGYMDVHLISSENCKKINKVLKRTK